MAIENHELNELVAGIRHTLENMPMPDDHTIKQLASAQHEMKKVVDNVVIALRPQLHNIVSAAEELRKARTNAINALQAGIKL